jgi:hypothetical protein
MPNSCIDTCLPPYGLRSREPVPDEFSTVSSKIRKPVHAVIDGEKYKFTRNEWKKALEQGAEYKADPKYVRRFLFVEEITQKVKLSPKLADQRALRLKKEADAAAEILLAENLKGRQYS